jgi:hypothetical protein
MSKDTRRSGLSLVLVGAIGILLFWVTDPRWGYFARPGAGENAIDQINQASPGTFIGIAGSIVVAIIGLWLMTRRTA